MNMQNQESESKQQGIIHRMKKADIVLIAVCLLAAALLGIFFVVHREAGREVRILYDGIELKKIDLYSAQPDSDMDTGSRYYLITYRDDVVGVENFESRPELPEVNYISYNLISVTEGTVVIEAADCKDQICVHHKPISSMGESIICLPHRLVVEIVGVENAGADTQDGSRDRNSERMPDEPLDGVVR